MLFNEVLLRGHRLGQHRLEMSLSAVVFGVKDMDLITISKHKLVKIDLRKCELIKKCFK